MCPTVSPLGLGVSDSLSPSISVVPGSESSRAHTLSKSEFGPSVLVGISIAAALDALVVRPVLLPAAVHLLGRWSWWPTAPPGVRTEAPTAPLSVQTTPSRGVS